MNKDKTDGLTVDAVIPTFQPGKRLIGILECLEKQTLPVRCVRIINSGRDGFRLFLEEAHLTEQQFLESYPFVLLEHIPKEEFDHGRTRSKGFAACIGADYVLAMTQDALPADEMLVERLVRPLTENADIAVSYARQLSNPDVSCEERISRNFNYPAQSMIKSEEDTGRLGIKAYFCSNVCAMYRRATWEQLGGFPEHAIFNEDMVYAGGALQAGYRIAYVADACVYHSHSYTAAQQFHRNFDLGVSQAQNPQIFARFSSEGEGMQYVKAVIRQMRKEKKAGEIPGFVLRCAARFAGYRMGKAYEHLPEKLILRFTSNRGFWIQQKQARLSTWRE